MFWAIIAQFSIKNCESVIKDKTQKLNRKAPSKGIAKMYRSEIKKTGREKYRKGKRRGGEGRGGNARKKETEKG
jgi:hypothetical protein